MTININPKFFGALGRILGALIALACYGVIVWQAVLDISHGKPPILSLIAFMCMSIIRLCITTNNFLNVLFGISSIPKVNSLGTTATEETQ